MALVVTPVAAGDMAVWTIEVVTTVTYSAFGSTKVKTYDAFTVTVGCTIASVPNPTAPSSGLTYDLYATQLVIPLS